MVTLKITTIAFASNSHHLRAISNLSPPELHCQYDNKIIWQIVYKIETDFFRTHHKISSHKLYFLKAKNIEWLIDTNIRSSMNHISWLSDTCRRCSLSGSRKQTRILRKRSTCEVWRVRWSNENILTHRCTCHTIDSYQFYIKFNPLKS